MTYAMHAVSRPAGQPAGRFRRCAIATGIALALACTALPAYAQKVELGAEANAGPDGTAIGAHTEATGNGATALGIYAQAIASQATAVGRDAQARAVSSLALGAGAIVEAAAVGSVALGAGSTATGLSLGTAAYLVGGTATAEVAIGGRRITGLAAGANPDDAATVGQLQAFTRNAVEYTDINDRTLVVLNRNVDGSAGPSTRITNLKAGDVADGSTDAINGDQLFDLKNTPMTFAGNAGTASVKLDETFTIQGGAPVAGGVSGRNISTRVNGNTLDVLMSESPTFGGVTVNASGTGRITGVAEGELIAGGTDAVNAGQLHEVDATARKGWNLSANGATAEHIAPGETVDFAQGSNVAVTRSGNTVTVGVVPDPTFAGRVTTNGGLTIGAGGLTVAAGQTLDVGNNVLANVAAGTSTLHAVNVGQLTALGDDVAAALGGASAFDANTQSLTTALNVGGVTYGNVNDALGALDTTANLGWTVQAGGVSEKVAPGGRVNLASGVNTVASYDASTDELKVDVVDAPTFAGMVTAAGGLTVGASTTVDMGGNVVTGVARGENPSDAVNKSQLDEIEAAAGLGWNLQAGAMAADKIGGGETVKIAAVSNASLAYDAAANELRIGVVDAPTFAGMVTAGGGLIVGAGTTVDMGNNVLANVAAGTSTLHAVNVGQLTALGEDVAAALGGASAFDANTQSLTTALNVGSVTYGNVNDALGALNATANRGWNLQVGAVTENVAPGDTVGLVNGTNTVASYDAANNQLKVSVVDAPTFAGKVTAEGGLTVTGGDFIVAGGQRIDMGGNVIDRVGAGTIDASSEHAVNGAQVFGISESLAQALGGGALVANDGSITTPAYALSNANAIAGNTGDANNVGGGFDKVDAALGALQSSIGDITQGNAGIRYFHVNSTRPDSQATGAEAIAIGPEALATLDHAVALGTSAEAAGLGSLALGSAAHASAEGSVAIGQGAAATLGNSVALGSGAVTSEVVGTAGAVIDTNTYSFAGSAPAGTVSVGSAGRERTITHLAAGRVDAGSTDAINGSQLHATNQAVEAIGSVAGNADELAVKYGWTDANGDGVASADEIDYGSVAMSGPQGTRVSNVAPALLAATSMDAVNGAQLFQSMEQVATLLGGGASMTSQGLAAPSYLIQGMDYHDVGAALEALDIHVTLLGGRPGGTQLAGYTHGRRDSGHPVYGDGGPGSTALGLDASAAGVENAVAIGQGATVAATRGTAVGQAASVTADNAVALGQGSVADRAGTVSVGSAGNERQIANVAAGTQATDAVNKGQLDRGVASANGYTDARVNALSDSFDVFRSNVGEELHRQDQRIDRQGAMSAAMMNMAMSAAGIHTQNRAAVGVGFQGGESAMSLGYQRALSERATITFGGAFSSDDQAVGFGAGVGW